MLIYILLIYLAVGMYLVINDFHGPEYERAGYTYKPYPSKLFYIIKYVLLWLPFFMMLLFQRSHYGNDSNRYMLVIVRRFKWNKMSEIEKKSRKLDRQMKKLFKNI